ncbi:MAG: glycosyltransferase family 4 protein [Thermodesulfobacteriota bacterium]
MRICIVTNEPFPQSIRLEKEIRTFQELGYEIHVVCFAEEGQPIEDVVSGTAVHRIRRLSGHVSKLSSLIYKIVFINIQVLRKLWLVIKQYDVHVLFVRDISFVLTACLLGKLHGSKVIYDVNDRYPLAMNAWGHRRSWNEKILMNTWRMTRLESRCVKAVDHIVVANPPYVDYFIKTGISEEKITLLPNYVDLSYIDELAHDPLRDRVVTLSPCFKILYSGAFGRHRGLDIAIKMMPLLIKQIPDVRLVIIGPISPGEESIRQELEELAKQLNITENVVFTGPLEFEEMLSYLNLSDICLIPFKRNSHTDTIVPHKLFEYMSQAKPVVTTNVKAVRQIVDSEKCGIVVSAENPLEMAEATVMLYNNPSYAAELGKQGRKAVETKYSWRRGATAFSEVLHRLEDTCRLGE